MQMVNARFPEPAGYGFEMVDAPNIAFFRAKPPSIENLHRIKSIGFFANFRRFNFNANTCDLSTAVSQGSIARSTATVAKYRNGTERDGRGRLMFFLLRMAFWLGLVLVLLPREKTPESDKLPQVGASEAVSAATAAVSDVGQFCKRQPAACEVGGQAATVIGHRATEGARKLYQIITDKRASDRTGSIGGLENAGATAMKEEPRDTLTPDDLVAEWRAPQAP
jgi:Family of unknown function (DUF5330)